MRSLVQPCVLSALVVLAAPAAARASGDLLFDGGLGLFRIAATGGVPVAIGDQLTNKNDPAVSPGGSLIAFTSPDRKAPVVRLQTVPAGRRAGAPTRTRLRDYAFDRSGIRSVRVSVDGRGAPGAATTLTGAPSFTRLVRGLAPGRHRFSFGAVDRRGNRTKHPTRISVALR